MRSLYTSSLKRTCYNCGLFGHQAKDCPQTGSPVCYNCGNDGHLSKHCTEPEKEKTCYNCGGVGHLLRNCHEEPRKVGVVPSTPASVASEVAVPTGPSSAMPAECYKCGRSGHIARHCQSHNRKQCFSCGSFGHISKECRQGQKCYKCGEMGHLSKDCKHADQEKVCYVCKLPGHLASSCSQSLSNAVRAATSAGLLPDAPVNEKVEVAGEAAPDMVAETAPSIAVADSA